MSMFPDNRKLIIAGPCALESRSLLAESVKCVKQLDISYMRACLWKPRTSPGWEGLGALGLYYLFEETLSQGVVPATEIISPEHAQLIVDAIKHFGDQGRVVVWLGARNQNHFDQRKIAQILAAGPTGITFMFKNQMWADDKHWYGIYQHITSAGFPRDRLAGIHRGFSPGFAENPFLLRNLPAYDMAMEMKRKMKIPMLIDPSHIAGSREKVFDIVEYSLNYNFDGYLVEFHPNITKARTDQNQQLSFDELRDLVEIIRSREGSSAVMSQRKVA